MAEEPLLNGGLSSGRVDYEAVRSVKEFKSMFWTETVKTWRIAAPITFNTVCNYGINSVTNIFVGHIGALELSAASISLFVIGTFSYGFLVGMGSATETLCGQTLGAGKIRMLGVYMQRSWIILSVTCIFLSPIYIFATPILKLVGQSPEVAEMARKFSILIIPQYFSFAISIPTQKFLQAQSKVNVVAWLGFVALILHIGILWLFIDGFGWGLVGAALALSVTNWSLVVAQLVYVFFWCNEGWSGFSRLAFNDMWPYVRLSVASGVMLCLEVWFMTSIIILTGHLDNSVIAVGSLSICMNLNGWAVMIFVGLYAAISVRVSNELGYGRPRAAKYSVYVIIFQSLILGVLCMIAVILAKDYFPLIFTNNKDLQVAASKLAGLLGICIFLNSVQPLISGVAVGAGWQALVAYINIGCYYVFGLPLGFLLGYKVHLGVKGLWGGMLCGVALQTLLLVIVLYKTNWKKEVEKTTERVREWGGQESINGGNV